MCAPQRARKGRDRMTCTECKMAKKQRRALLLEEPQVGGLPSTGEEGDALLSYLSALNAFIPIFPVNSK